MHPMPAKKAPRIERIRQKASYTLSPETLERIADLEERLELPASRVIDLAIRELWRATEGKEKER